MKILSSNPNTITVVFDVFVNDEYYSAGPSYAKAAFTIDELEKMDKDCDTVSALGYHKVSEFDYRLDWLGEKDENIPSGYEEWVGSTDLDMIQISTGPKKIHFGSVIKHTSIGLDTSNIEISELISIMKKS